MTDKTDKKNEYIGKMKKQYDDLSYNWSRKSDKYEAQIQNQGADAKKAYEEKKAEYLKSSDDMKAKMKDLEAAGDSDWKDVKDGAQKSWHKLSNAFDSATSHFKK